MLKDYMGISQTNVTRIQDEEEQLLSQAPPTAIYKS